MRTTPAPAFETPWDALTRDEKLDVLREAVFDELTEYLATAPSEVLMGSGSNLRAAFRDYLAEAAVTA